MPSKERKELRHFRIDFDEFATDHRFEICHWMCVCSMTMNYVGWMLLSVVLMPRTEIDNFSCWANGFSLSSLKRALFSGVVCGLSIWRCYSLPANCMCGCVDDSTKHGIDRFIWFDGEARLAHILDKLQWNYVATGRMHSENKRSNIATTTIAATPTTTMTVTEEEEENEKKMEIPTWPKWKYTTETIHCEWIEQKLVKYACNTKRKMIADRTRRPETERESEKRRQNEMNVTQRRRW